MLETVPSIKKWNMEDMETLAGVISEIRKDGREALKAKWEARRRITAENQRRINEIVLKSFVRKAGGGDDYKDRLAGGADARAKDYNFLIRVKGLFLTQMNARRFWRMIEGGQDGFLHSLITQGNIRRLRTKTGMCLSGLKKWTRL
jgi:hypothetical protein